MAFGCLSYALKLCRQKVQGETVKWLFLALVVLVLLNQLLSLYHDGLAMTKGHTLIVPARFYLYHVLPKAKEYVPSLAQIR